MQYKCRICNEVGGQVDIEKHLRSEHETHPQQIEIMMLENNEAVAQ